MYFSFILFPRAKKVFPLSKC